MEHRTRSPSSSSERWPHLKTTALHGAARHGNEHRERGRQIPHFAESAWEYRCKRRRRVRRLIGSQPEEINLISRARSRDVVFDGVPESIERKMTRRAALG